MPQLIQMTQRIGAVGTIKKITHAMRLVAMSSHTRLSTKEPLLANYKNEIKALFGALIAESPGVQQQLFTLSPQAHKTLTVLIGSQKGLCGTFNVALFKFFEAQRDQLHEQNDIIVVGKKAQEYLKKKHIEPIEVFNNLTINTLPTITELLTSQLINKAHDYSQVLFISNHPRTFFSQKAIKTQLLPLDYPQKTAALSEEYIWEEPRDTILQTLARLYVHVSVQSVLFSSLVAEQAARFQSMDTATRNAQDLLEIMRRDYNKMRQAKITKELLELAGSFQR